MKRLFCSLTCILFPLAAGAAGKAPSDANIAAIAVVANQIDVDAANLALGKTTNPEVKKFAELMVSDHSSVIKKAGELAGKLKLTPEDDDTSRSLKSDATAFQGKLKAASGAEFDRLYVDHEIAYHQAVLDAIDKLLVPNAKNAQLKDLLVAVRPVVAQHLEHAKTLAKSLPAGK
jgi:putative membrane protein